jgi:3-hydroxyisobutyrate dehydrogenase-like beta-hydroxyacid dehydrogenase
MALVDANGISAAKFLDAFVEHGTRSGIADMKLPAMITGDFEPRFALKHMSKDMQLALQEGKAAGVELPAAAATAGALLAGMQKGWSDLDFSAIAQHYAFPGREPLTSNVLATAAGDTGPKPKRFSLFGGSPRA